MHSTLFHAHSQTWCVGANDEKQVETRVRGIEERTYKRPFFDACSALENAIAGGHETPPKDVNCIRLSSSSSTCREVKW